MKVYRKREAAPCSLNGAVTASLKLEQNNFLTQFILQTLFYCYQAFKQWHFTASIGNRLMMNISRTGLFGSFNKSKLIALIFLIISLIGARGRKNEKLQYRNSFIYILIGLFLYFASWGVFFLELSVVAGSIVYMS